jgi:hypothetical protein
LSETLTSIAPKFHSLICAAAAAAAAGALAIVIKLSEENLIAVGWSLDPPLLIDLNMTCSTSSDFVVFFRFLQLPFYVFPPSPFPLSLLPFLTLPGVLLPFCS